MGKLVVKVDPATNSFRQSFEADVPFPPHLPLVIGDCLSNARTCLDYLVWELALAAKTQPTNRHSFPVCKAPESFSECRRKGRFAGLSDEMIAEIEFLQPYSLGKDFKQHSFWVLDELCNINKHRRILLAKIVPGIARKAPGSDRYTIVKQGWAGKMEVNDEIIAFIGFDERGLEDGPDASAILYECIDSIERILPNFDRFFS